MYRGYLLNRLGSAIGNGRASTPVAVLLTAVTFGLVHSQQGFSGILDNVLAGAFFALLYLGSGRNLWLPIVVHGTIDTAGMILLFLGFRPG